MADNVVTGNWTLAQLNNTNLFFRPTTDFEGCYNQVPEPEPPLDYWVEQKKIDALRASIREDVFKIYNAENCEAEEKQKLDKIAEERNIFIYYYDAFILSDEELFMNETAIELGKGAIEASG